MPHKVNQSNSTLASTGSSGDRVVVTDLRGGTNIRRNKTIRLGQAAVEVNTRTVPAFGFRSPAAGQRV
ncbi:hypothetical protein APSETT444_008207 [Aspergillus pseudonomiae]